MTRRRSLRRWLLVGGGVLLAVTGLAWSGLARDVARVFGQGLAGHGTLAWEDASGGWNVVPEPLATRRHFGPADAFLVGDATPAWAYPAPGLAQRTLRFQRPPNPQTVEVLVARVDPARWAIRAWGRPDWSRDDVGVLAREAGMVLAVNGSYFDDEGPLGLVVSDGVTRSTRRKGWPTQFLVGADGRPRIVTTKGGAPGAVTQGIQARPALLHDGRVYGYIRSGGRTFDPWVVDRRTAACTDRGGKLLLVVTETHTNGLSLDELATVLGGLGCMDAMAFDGGSSTGSWSDVGGWSHELDNTAPVPVVVGISPRN